MLFNSFIFIFGFLPVAFVAFYLLRRANKLLGMWALTIASLVFYAWWLPSQSWILLVSILLNFGVGRFIQTYRESRPQAARLMLYAGLTANLGALFYFKYSMFFLENLNRFGDADFTIPHILLPLGISFFTFQKIAYIVDSARGEVKRTSFSEFALFASFFPQLISGPIVHHKEIIPQFRDKLFGVLQWSNVLVGLTIFSFGLFKKTVIADSIAAYFIPLYKTAAATGHVDPQTGWVIAVGWTLQVYFDFSGYSDMAIGLGRMFGVRLPLNFHSPLRAASIIDYWRRWHMSLQRFILSYVFQPLALPLTRFSTTRKLKGWTEFAVTVVTPSFLTFFLLGVWHGAGWGYVVYGLLNGFYVSVNEAYRELKRRRRRRLRRAGLPAPKDPGVLRRTGYHVLTLACALTGNMFFRAESLHDGVTIFQGMWGLNGLAANPALAGKVELGFLAVLLAAASIIVFLPNTQQIMRAYRPAANWAQWKDIGWPAVRWRWRPAPIYLVYVAFALFVGVQFIQRGAEVFVYFAF